MTVQTQESLLKKLNAIDQMPTLPVILTPLLRYMEQPLEKLGVQQVVDLISQDKSLTAQCLQMANSPLFGQWQTIDSVRAAVMALGMQRMRDIVMSCSVLTLLPRETAGFDPIVFWEHSLGCALVSRQFARKIGFSDPGKAYLGGLLHDIGIIAHLWVAPAEFRATIERASTEHIPLHEAEQAVLGMNHTESGRIVAERWHFTPDLVQVVTSHHDANSATSERALVALVSLSDLLCRMGGLGYGYSEDRQVNFLEEPGFAILEKECPKLDSFDWARFTFELEAYLDEVHQLVNLLYRGSQ
ncbi:MAG TPA: HDOD domain-containing protein [Terriglobales bacterium]|nr:HDOD domain-containing protein [Terriglobales bacterium]